MIDRYTKFILTVIAACLVILVVRQFSVGTPAHAQAQLTHVVLEAINPRVLQFLQPVPVRVEYPVRIQR